MNAQPIASLSVAEMAALLFDTGVLAFPAKKDGKHPYVQWGGNRFPNGWPSRKAHAAMFALPGAQRLFVVCGKRSDGVACIDFDQPTFFEQWAALVYPEILEKLYIEQSQRSGGYHVAFKVAPAVPSTVPARNARSEDGKIGAVRIEVRGEGNGFVAAPSPGYQWIQGDLTALPLLAAAEYERLLTVAATFNECEVTPEPERPKIIRLASEDELPGTRFNRENRQGEVVALFQRHGYRAGKRDAAGNVAIVRPGATSETSGNVNRDGVLHMFSTNTPFIPSESGKGNPYTPFAVFTWLEHGGDYAAAGRALYRQYSPSAVRVVRERNAEEEERGGGEMEGEGEAEEGRRYRLYSDLDLENLKPPTFFIDDLLPARGLFSTVGASGSYKTFGALDMSLCIATGTPFLGRKTRQAPVIYVSAEGQGGFGLRVRAWKVAHEMERAENFHAILDAPQLLQDDDEITLIRTIRDLGATEGMLVLDTRARTFSGDENSVQDIGKYIQACDRIGAATGWLTNAIHHHGKAGTTRGSSAWFAALDGEITYSLDEETRIVSVSVTKAKDWSSEEVLAFAPSVIDLGVDEEGKERSSVVLVPIEKPNVPVRVNERNRRCIIALYGLNNSGMRYGEWQRAAEISETSLRRAKDDLRRESAIYERNGYWVVSDEGIEKYAPFIERNNPVAKIDEQKDSPPVPPNHRRGGTGGATQTTAATATPLKGGGGGGGGGGISAAESHEMITDVISHDEEETDDLF